MSIYSGTPELGNTLQRANIWCPNVQVPQGMNVQSVSGDGYLLLIHMK